MADINMPTTADFDNPSFNFDIERLERIAYRGVPVVTTELLARAYGTKEVRIRQNYSRNEDRFIEGVHFFKVKGGGTCARSELRIRRILSLESVPLR